MSLRYHIIITDTICVPYAQFRLHALMVPLHDMDNKCQPFVEWYLFLGSYIQHVDLTTHVRFSRHDYDQAGTVILIPRDLMDCALRHPPHTDVRVSSSDL